MKCIIIEDELPAQQLLLNYIERTADLSCVGVYTSVSEVSLPGLAKIDLLFLDIQLPELNGLDFLRTLEKRPSIIITTAYREYAIDAFEEAVSDYLLKPFSYQRFLKAIFRVQKEILPEQEESSPDSIFVYADRTFKKIVKSDILYIKAEVDYVMIYFGENKFLIKDSLNNWEEKLKDAGFIRVHRSYLINFEKVESIEGNVIKIATADIPIGKTFREPFFALVKSRH
ncbi:MAG: LytTR family DNA-binding domain-containing protein [Bacteroidia bacterium]|nr:LytTR family DNA-binding domain-containing protein [Bacteroidia bacterium]